MREEPVTGIQRTLNSLGVSRMPPMPTAHTPPTTAAALRTAQAPHPPALRCRCGRLRGRSSCGTSAPSAASRMSRICAAERRCPCRTCHIRDMPVRFRVRRLQARHCRRVPASPRCAAAAKKSSSAWAVEQPFGPACSAQWGVHALRKRTRRNKQRAATTPAAMPWRRSAAQN